MYAAEFPFAQICISDDGKAETVQWERHTKKRLSLPYTWFTSFGKFNNDANENSSEDGLVLSERSFRWTEPSSNDAPSNPPPDDKTDSKPKPEKHYLLNTGHLTRQMQKIQNQEDRNLVCLQRTMEIIAIAALLLFFL